MKPTLKAPGSERLKLEHEKLHSNFAFNFNLRRYSEDDALCGVKDRIGKMLARGLHPDTPEAGAYTRPLISST